MVCVGARLIVAILFVLWFRAASQPCLYCRDWVMISDFENLTGDSIFDKSLSTALDVSMSSPSMLNLLQDSNNTVLQRMGGSRTPRLTSR